MATSEAASAAELVKKADDERLATANAERMRRVAAARTRGCFTNFGNSHRGRQ